MPVRLFLIFVFLFCFIDYDILNNMTSKVVIAHRGLSGSYPENTLISFRKALETKASWIECDVHLSKDDEVMVIHDEKLERTTTEKGGVGDYTKKELKQFSAGFSQKFQNQFLKEKIPTLLEVLELIKGKDKGLLIEIKSHEKDALFYHNKVGNIVYDAVLNHFPSFKDRVVFISFNTLILEKIKRLDASAHIAPIFNEHPKNGSLADQALELETDKVIFSKKLLEIKDVIQTSKKVKHFVYTILPQEFDKIEKVAGLYGFATDFANLVPFA